MGVNELWDALKPGFDERVPFEVFATRFLQENKRPLRIAIDGHGWVFEVFSKVQSQSIPVWPESLFMSRVMALMRSNVSFVIVFDGKYKPNFKHNHEVADDNYVEEYIQLVRMIYGSKEADFERREADEKRSEADEKCSEETTTKPSKKASRKLSKKTSRSNKTKDHGREFEKCLERLKMRLRMWNCAYVEGAGEGEAECSFLQALGVVDYVMTNDVDAFVFGATKVLRNYSQFIEDAPVGASSSYHSDGSTKWVTPVDIKKVEKVTGFDRWRLILFAMLRGSDYSGGTKGLGGDRAKIVALLGSSKQIWQKKADDDLDFVPPDFSRLLKGIYTSSFVLEHSVRRKSLEDLNALLKKTLVENSYNLFGQYRDESNFIDGAGNLIGAPTDSATFCIVYPVINRTNIFVFVNGMSNFAEKDYVMRPNDIDISVLDLDHLLGALGKEGVVTKIKVRRCSGVNSMFDYVVCENCYKLMPISKRWVYEYCQSFDESVSENSFDYFIFDDSLGRDENPKVPTVLTRFNHDFSKAHSDLRITAKVLAAENNWELKPERTERIMSDLFKCYMLYFLVKKAYLHDNSSIYFDMIKSVSIPSAKSQEFAPKVHSIDKIRVTYKKSDFLDDFKMYKLSEKTETLEHSTEKLSNTENFSEKSSIKGAETTKESSKSTPPKETDSVWITKEVANYYVPEMVKKCEKEIAQRSLEKEKKKLRKTPSQKNVLDRYDSFKSSSSLRKSYSLSTQFGRNAKSAKRIKSQPQGKDIMSFFKDSKSNSSESKVTKPKSLRNELALDSKVLTSLATITDTSSLINSVVSVDEEHIKPHSVKKVGSKNDPIVLEFDDDETDRSDVVFIKEKDKKIVGGAKEKEDGEDESGLEEILSRSSNPFLSSAGNWQTFDALKGLSESTMKDEDMEDLFLDDAEFITSSQRQVLEDSTQKDDKVEV